MAVAQDMGFDPMAVGLLLFDVVMVVVIIVIIIIILLSPHYSLISFVYLVELEYYIFNGSYRDNFKKDYQDLEVPSLSLPSPSPFSFLLTFSLSLSLSLSLSFSLSL